MTEYDCPIAGVGLVGVVMARWITEEDKRCDAFSERDLMVAVLGIAEAKLEGAA